MSIRLIAQDLYRLIGEVEALQRQIQAAPDGRKAALSDALRKKKAERDHLRRVLDGRKG